MADLNSYPLRIKQGESYNERFQWCNYDLVPYDLTGYTAKGQIRNGAQNPGVLLEIVVTIIDAANGVFDLDILATSSKNIPTTGSNYVEIDLYVYDVYFTSPDGSENYRVMQGVVEVSPEVTK